VGGWGLKKGLPKMRNYDFFYLKVSYIFLGSDLRVLVFCFIFHFLIQYMFNVFLCYCFC
jgi:hypothetical protein